MALHSAVVILFELPGPFDRTPTRSLTSSSMTNFCVSTPRVRSPRSCAVSLSASAARWPGPGVMGVVGPGLGVASSAGSEAPRRSGTPAGEASPSEASSAVCRCCGSSRWMARPFRRPSVSARSRRPIQA